MAAEILCPAAQRLGALVCTIEGLHMVPHFRNSLVLGQARPNAKDAGVCITSQGTAQSRVWSSAEALLQRSGFATRGLLVGSDNGAGLASSGPARQRHGPVHEN